MREDFSQTALEGITGDSTQPVYLCELDIGLPEYLSTNGTWVEGEHQYTGGDVSLSSIDGWMTATITVSATTERVARIQAGLWQRARCLIYLYAGRYLPPLVEESYLEEGYYLYGQLFDPVLLVDGVVVSASVGDRITLSVAHRALAGAWAPRVRATSDWLRHLPQPGTRFEWEGEIYILEGSRR